MACVLCLLGPDAQQMAVPIAQATLITAPLLLRAQLGRGIRALRHRPAVPPAVPEESSSATALGSRVDTSAGAEPDQ